MNIVKNTHGPFHLSSLPFKNSLGDTSNTQSTVKVKKSINLFTATYDFSGVWNGLQIADATIK